MKSFLTSYNGLFSRLIEEAPIVERIEIPIIQRDYAQGRESEQVRRIRENFLNVLYGAVTTGASVGLDFVYGDVVNGTLRPLDGQQRLTTLFLLHWYVAWRADVLDQEQGWKNFEYATRPSARRFCARLVKSKPPHDAKLRDWFRDQHWFLHTWQLDPSIQSMLVMLEAIHERFADADCAAAWNRLVDSNEPAVAFHLLPIEQMGLSEDLYIKMNSRGRPLSAFENFKARFEQLLELSCPERVEEFARKVDGAWVDLLWSFRGDDDTVDDELLNYIRFVTDICDWSDGRLPLPDLGLLAERVYGTSENSAAHLDFLVRCFDTWVDADTALVFSSAFSVTPGDPSKVVLFSMPGGTVNLFADCCRGQVRRSLSADLLLYAVLVHRLQDTDEFPRRLRMLRNLIAASENEIRAERMQVHLSDVRRLIVDGALADLSSFNQTQVADEQFKAGFLKEMPELGKALFNLEDHALLRGCLSAFELNATSFEHRANAFAELFPGPSVPPLITGALLAAGDYSRHYNHRFIQLGSGVDFLQWRNNVLTGFRRDQLTKVRVALACILDALAERNGSVESTLQFFRANWLQDVDSGKIGLDWRWYFVHYPEMRDGHSGIYACPGGVLGYNVCMLDKKAMSSHYRDPYLSAIRQQSGVQGSVVRGSVAIDRFDGPWFTGYESEERWMVLVASGAKMLCREDCLKLDAPTDPAHLGTFERVCAIHSIGDDLCLKIPQVAVGGRQLDSVDRVQLGASLLRDFAAAGL